VSAVPPSLRSDPAKLRFRQQQLAAQRAPVRNRLDELADNLDLPDEANQRPAAAMGTAAAGERFLTLSP